MLFLLLFLRDSFFVILFDLSQHEMTKFSVWGSRKKCAVPSCDTKPSCDGSGFESKIHKNLVLLWHAALILLSNYV